MSFFTPFRIVIVLCVLGSCWNESAAKGAEGSKGEIVLKKRDIECSSTDVDAWIRESPETASRSHDDLNGTSPDRDTASSAQNIYHHHEQIATLDFEKNELPSARRSFIQENLAAHHEKIPEMRTEWQKLGRLIDFLENHIEWLRNWGKVATDKTIEGVLEDTRNCHKYVLQLIQDLLRSWGGLDGIVIGAQDSGQDAHESKKDVALRPPKKLRFEEKQEGKVLNASGISKCSRSSQVMGHSSIFTVLRENIISQRKASMEVTQVQQSPSLTENLEELRLNHFDLISKKLKADSVLKFNKLLQSVTFPPADFDLGEPRREQRRAIKSCFETFVFQAIQYMYKFGLISKEHLRQFFLEENTEKITGIHLTDLFKVYWDGFLYYDEFIPDLKFLFSHWYTEHIHISLKVLDEHQQALVLYTALQETVKAYYDLEEIVEVKFERAHAFIVDESFSHQLKSWQTRNKEFHSSPDAIVLDSELRKHFKNLIELFQVPTPDPRLENNDIYLVMRRIDYLLIHYILNFMKNYHPEILSQFFGTPSQYSTFKTQVEMLQMGIEIHQSLIVSKEFKNTRPPEYLELNTNPARVERFEDGTVKKEIEGLSESYINLWNEVSRISEVDSKVKNWMKGSNVSENIIKFTMKKGQDLKNMGFDWVKLNNEYKNNWMVRL